MKLSRRDLLVWGAGAAAGLMVTPVPWKVLDDVSIWSQNWKWIPQPARGPVDVKQTFCTLCPKGCGLRVRMAAGWPVGVAGLKTHPISRGALCPLAFGAHQLNWHPKRLRVVRHKGSSSSWEAAQAAFAKACTEGPVVVIDGYPGRAVSSVLESFSEKHSGEYRVVFGAEARSLTPYEKWSGVPIGSLGYDVEHAKTILSFGAPMLDGWGVPGRFTRAWAERASGARNPQLRLIQAESALSRTAARAWQWIRIREGSDSALAAGLAHALTEQNLVPAHGPVPPMSMAEAASQTEIGVDAIQALARTMTEQRPTLVIARNENPAVAALNVLLESIGVPGGVVRSSKNDRPLIAAGPEMANARAVVIDASVPWGFVPRTDAEVFRFAAWDGDSSRADWLLPSPGFLEETTDVPTAPGSTVESYAIANSLVKPTADARSAAQFLAALDSSVVSAEKIIQQRCQELYQRHTGSVFSPEITPVTKFASAAKFEEELRKGSVWVGEVRAAGQLGCELKEWPADVLSTTAADWVSEWGAPVLPPLASKLYVESTLRESPARRNA